MLHQIPTIGPLFKHLPSTRAPAHCKVIRPLKPARRTNDGTMAFQNMLERADQRRV